MKILSYNCRGLGSSAKKDELREWFRKERCDVSLIQESKLDHLEDGLFEILGGGSEIRGVAKNSNGRAGGLIIIWNSNYFIVRSSWDWEIGLAINGYSIEKGVNVCTINIYGPPEFGNKIVLWE